jgi:hypothetical protein
VLLGRKNFEGFAGYWPSVADGRRLRECRGAVTGGVRDRMGNNPAHVVVAIDAIDAPVQGQNDLGHHSTGRTIGESRFVVMVISSVR